MARWVMRIQEYDLEFIHRKGSENKIADALSRMERVMTDSDQDQANVEPEFDAQEEHLLMKIHKAPKATPVCVKEKDTPLLNVENIDEWKQAQLDEQWINQNYRHAIDGTLPEGKKDLARVIASQGQFVVLDGLLRRITWLKEGKQSKLHTPLVVPRSKVEQVLQVMHDSPLTGAHMGVERTMGKTIQSFWWPRMYTDVKKYVEACEKCQRTKPGKRKKAVIGGHPMGAAPFDLIACDLLSMPESTDGNKYILMIADYFTRFLIAVPVKDKTATTIAKAIVYHQVLKYGPPRRILTDNGGEFKNELLDEVCKALKTTKIYTSPFHPQTDGVVERLNQTVLNMMSVYVDADQRNWDEVLPFITFAHNAAPTVATGISPFKALYGRECPTPIELALEPSYTKLQGKDMNQTWQEMHANMQETAAWMQEFQNQQKNKEARVANRKRAQPQQFESGMVVWILNNKPPSETQKPKLLPRYRGPFVVQHMVGKVAVKLRKIASADPTVTVHVDNVKPMKGPKGRVVRLTKWYRETRAVERAQEKEGDLDERYEVEKVVSHNIKDGKFYLELKWKGYAETTYEEEIQCDCHDLLEEYYESNKAKPSK